MRKSFLFLAAAALLLSACKAKIVELDLKQDDLQAVQNGEVKYASFEAKFSNIGKLDDEQRAQVTALENILENYMDLDDFELASTDMGFDVIVEGSIPISNQEQTASAYYMLVEPSVIFKGYHLVQLRTGDAFKRMSSEMKAINFMLAPDEFHPTTIKVRADNMDVIVIGAEMDGEANLVWQGTVERRERFSFSGGIFDKTGAGIFFK